MAVLKTLGAYALAGGIVGAVVATLLAPGFLSWYNTPGGTAQALCTCQELVRSTAAGLINAQLTGTVVGAVAMLIVGILVVRARRRRAPVAPAAGGMT